MSDVEKRLAEVKRKTDKRIASVTEEEMLEYIRQVKIEMELAKDDLRSERESRMRLR